MAYIELRPDGAQNAHGLAGTTFNRDLAAIIGIDQSNLSRLIAGKAKPGVRFIAGVIDAFGVNHLLDVVRVVSERTEDGA